MNLTSSNYKPRQYIEEIIATKNHRTIANKQSILNYLILI